MVKKCPTFYHPTKNFGQYLPQEIIILTYLYVNSHLIFNIRLAGTAEDEKTYFLTIFLKLN